MRLQLSLIELAGGGANSSGDTSSLVNKVAAVAAKKSATTEKFWILEDLWAQLTSAGIGDKIADGITFLIACAVLVLLVWMIDVIVVRIALVTIQNISEHSKTKLDDYLLHRKFFHRLFHLLPLLVVLLTCNTLFQGFSEGLLMAVTLITQSLIIFVVLTVIFSLLNALNDRYLEKPQAQQRSITGYIQVAKIILAFLAVILIIARLTQKDPTNLLAGLGAAAALLSLVFKDTIMGFVASIQLSAQDMVRPGDWIEMPSKHADGIVLDMTVSSVKVQNWDNTITLIPIYSMITDSFTNWRGMEDSAGRRFVRYININIESIKIANQTLLSQLKANETVEPRYEQMVKLARESSPEALTNMALYRAFIQLFLQHHPKVNQQSSIFVRYTGESTEKGLRVEIYAYSLEKSASQFDAVHRSVVEYVVAVAPLFDIILFQAPTGVDFQKMV